MTDKEKIISEIQRRINLFRKAGKLGSDTEIALYGLINFINAMQEEPLIEDLEEEWNRYITSEEYLKDIPGGLPVARHFAKWQKQQMMKNLPSWKKSKKLIEGALLDRGILYIPRYMIELSELKKLPKED